MHSFLDSYIIVTLTLLNWTFCRSLLDSLPFWQQIRQSSQSCSQILSTRSRVCVQNMIFIKFSYYSRSASAWWRLYRRRVATADYICT